MKLSQLTTDETLDVLCEITPYINNIVIDQELTTELRRKVDPENLKTRTGVMLEGAKKLNVLIPVVLKKRRDDVYGILSALNKKEPEEIAKQSFIATVNQIREVLEDKELINFFESFVQPEAKE